MSTINRDVHPGEPLLPRHRIRFYAWAGDGPKFSAIFRAAWGRIPLGSRRRILAHWRQGYLGQPGPLVEVLDYPPDGDRAMAMASHFGHRLQFQAEYVDAMPGDVLQDLIAHELAHVVQSASGIRCTARGDDGTSEWSCQDGSYFGDALEIEQDADETMAAWGFDPNSPDRWMAATGRARRVEFGTQEESLRAVAARIVAQGR